MRPHEKPVLYMRGAHVWCYFRGRRWSMGTSDMIDAKRRVDEAVGPQAPKDAPVEPNIRHAIRLFLDALELRGRAEATGQIAKQKCGTLARVFGDRPLASMTAATIREFIAVRVGEGVSRNTVGHELGMLRQCWQLAHAEGWVRRSWREVMPERFDRHAVPRTRWLTREEVDAVLRALEAKEPHRAAWVAWVVGTGSDVGDVIRAEKGDLDWTRGVVRVRGTKTTFRDRLVPITPLTEALLRRAERFGPPFAPWTFPTADLRKVAARIGIPHFCAKDLRRTHGQWLRHAGVAPHLIGKILGHANSVMAERVYAQGDDLEIARLVRTALDPAPTTPPAPLLLLPPARSSA